jgi:signal peptidase II
MTSAVIRTTTLPKPLREPRLHTMLSLVAFLIAVPLLDHGVKASLRQSLGTRTVSLGMLGSVRVVSGRMWMTRLKGTPSPAFLWLVWFAAAGALVTASIFLPEGRPFAGLLLGGSLSHAWESTRSGTICDYICLRFWPAFNLADVAITIGGLGLIWSLALAMKGGLA